MNYKSIMMSFIVVFLFGCSALSIGGNKEQEAILKFINEDVQEASEHQENSALIFNEVLLETTVYEDMAVDRIKDEAIPEAEKAVEVAEAIEIDIEELETPHAYVTEALQYYVDALHLIVETIETGDYDVEEQAEEGFENYETTLEKYHESVEDLAKEFDIEYERQELSEDFDVPELEEEEMDESEDTAQTIDTDTQDAILTFINEDVDKLTTYEIEAMEALNNVTGENYTDDETVYNTIVDEVVPAYEDLLKEAEKIRPDVDVLMEPYELLVEASISCLESFEVRADAIKEEDMDLLEEADELFDVYLEGVDEYHFMLTEIAEAHDIQYEPQF